MEDSPHGKRNEPLQFFFKKTMRTSHGHVRRKYGSCHRGLLWFGLFIITVYCSLEIVPTTFALDDGDDDDSPTNPVRKEMTSTSTTTATTTTMEVVVDDENPEQIQQPPRKQEQSSLPPKAQHQQHRHQTPPRHSQPRRDKQDSYEDSDDDDANNAASTGDEDESTNSHDYRFKPVDLTARNFTSQVTDGNVWLVEFYSPKCYHCVEFASTYEEMARFYHSSKSPFKIKVGKVNGEQERALLSRFDIYAYPSFYVIDGYQVYSFEEDRNKKTLMAFAEGGYKKVDPIPFYSSPMGPLGLLQGALITAGMIMADIFAWSQQTLGFSPLVTAGILFVSFFLGCFVVIVLLAIIATPKMKQD